MDTPAFGISIVWTIALTTVIAVGGAASGAHEASDAARELPYFFFDWDQVRAADAPMVANLVPGPSGTCSGHIESHVEMGAHESGVKSLGLRPVDGRPCAFEAHAVIYEGLEADLYRWTSGVPLLGGTPSCLEAMGCVPAKAPWERPVLGGMVQPSVPAAWWGPGIN